jgi:hypothetical protein
MIPHYKRKVHKALFMFLGCPLTAMVAANFYAAGAESNAGGGIGAFLPLVIIFAISYWGLIKPLSKRKGRSQVLAVLLSSAEIISLAWRNLILTLQLPCVIVKFGKFQHVARSC